MELQYALVNFVKKNGGNCDHGRGNFNNWGGHDQIWNNLNLSTNIQHQILGYPSTKVLIRVLNLCNYLLNKSIEFCAILNIE